MSHDHFTVDGTLIEAWASLKSFRRKDEKPADREPPDDPGNPTVDFRGEKRSNETHESTTDKEARLAKKKGKESRLSYSAHALMENRNGLLVDFRIEQADGFAERRAALDMLDTVVKERRITVGGDKGYDTADFVRDCRAINVTPHIAQTSDTRRRSAIDDRTTRHPGYLVSQRKRKLVEEIFGWMKTVGNFRRTRFKGLQRTRLAALFVGAAYNLLRICRLAVCPPDRRTGGEGLRARAAQTRPERRGEYRPPIGVSQQPVSRALSTNPFRDGLVIDRELPLSR